MFNILLFLVPIANAQMHCDIKEGNCVLETGIRATFPQLMSRIVGWLATSGVAVCAAFFLVGAFMMVLNSAKPDKAEQGKDIMIQSMIGLFVILGAYGILRTVFYVLI